MRIVEDGEYLRVHIAQQHQIYYLSDVFPQPFVDFFQKLRSRAVAETGLKDSRDA